MRELRWMSSALLGSAVAVLALSAAAVGTRRFALDQGSDFKGGDLKGVAVDSNGGVRAGLTLVSTPVAEGSSIWAALPQRDGSVLLGTGNEGKLVRVQNGTTSVVAETKALVATSLVEVWGGSVAVGTLPDGKVLRFDRGKLAACDTFSGQP